EAASASTSCEQRGAAVLAFGCKPCDKPAPAPVNSPAPARPPALGTLTAPDWRRWRPAARADAYLRNAIPDPWATKQRPELPPDKDPDEPEWVDDNAADTSQETSHEDDGRAG